MRARTTRRAGFIRSRLPESLLDDEWGRSAVDASPLDGHAMDRDRTPTFMIIGAAKSGTTSLHYYLDLHPQVAMSRPKETDFFLRADFQDALDDYAACFEPGTAARGEASIHYTCWPEIPDIPERISSVLPDVKLIYCVRDPVDRAIGHYYERYQAARAPRSIDAAFSDLDDSKVWIAASKYAMQLERYLAYFPRANLMLVDARDLRLQRNRTLRSVFEFIGVDPDFSSPRFEDELNVRLGGRKRMTFVGRAMRRSPVAELARRALPPATRERLFAPVRKLALRPFPLQTLPDHARARLAAYLSEDIDRFRTLAGRRFDHWSV